MGERGGGAKTFFLELLNVRMLRLFSDVAYDV